MAPLDLGGLAPISDDQPAGANLELDPEFGALERAAQGKPEVQYGSTVEPAEPPDWKLTIALAEPLLERTHDLRVMVHLATARLHLHGLVGFAAAVASIRHEIESNWQYVHPQLDPDDDNDPMQRANALLPLRDKQRVLRTLRDLRLAGNRVERVSWRDIAVMTGAIEPEPGAEKRSEAAILGAFGKTDPAELAATAAALDTLMLEIPGIADAFDRSAGVGLSPDFEPLTALLREMQRDVSRFRAASAASADEPAQEAGASAAEPGDGGAPASAGSRGGHASLKSIASLSRRDEAIYALDLAAAYFRVQEPSSPLPLLIERAKRLAGMEFMDILRDLAPDGLSQAQLVAGASGQ